MRWLDGITDSVDTSLSELQENDEGWGSLGAVVRKVIKSQTRLNNKGNGEREPFPSHVQRSGL